MYYLKQSTVITLPFFAHDVAGDAVLGMVDGGFTKRISKDGATFAAMAVTITEAENGWYFYTISAFHSNNNGILSLTFTNAACKQVNLQFRVEPTLIDVNVDSIDGSIAAAVRLALSAGQIIPGTVDTGAPHTPTTQVFEADDITEATTSHYVGRLILWTSGDLAGQMARIQTYILVGSNGRFTVSTMTEAPANNDTFIVI